MGVFAFSASKEYNYTGSTEDVTQYFIPCR